MSDRLPEPATGPGVDGARPDAGRPDAPLPRDWYARPTLEVARSLLGCLIVTDLPEGRSVGRIVETEAYLGPRDPASHAWKGRKGRVSIMWDEPGHAYVYRSYGIHAMLNAVAKAPGEVGGVLIRAVEPVAGIELMRARRGLDDPRGLGSGPGKLTQALGITLDEQGTDLTRHGLLWLAPGWSPEAISHGRRIGISRAVEHPYRYWETGNPCVSAHRKGEPWDGEDALG
ncbi:MAG: DNA-3-methyladenine glycosylase [Thermomicrobiales bacterium]|nr:DNA-3-methyladenine glycosylase [Thermomicrobiales bacterium]